jgi:phenylacetate-CoA ligase
MWQPAIEGAAPETVDALQRERLPRLVRRLYRQVPFYRQRLKAAGLGPGDAVTPEGLFSLPMTTKADLRDQYPFGLLCVPEDRIARVHATSGTKGKPTVVAYTAADLRTWAELAARMLAAAGCRRGDVWYVASGYGLFTGGLGAHYGVERVGATVVPASGGNTARLLALMADIRPTGIHCIPSYMLRLAEVAREGGIDPRSLGLRHGSFGGETWTEPLRRRIEDLYGMVACDVYGLSECYGPGVAYECQAKDGLHLAADHMLAEIVNPATGKPLPEGETGELVLTTLTKQAMPLLRYRTGDLTRFLPGTCACGRTLRRIARIGGRTDDMLVIRGVNLYPAEVERLLLAFPELGPQYRLVVERPAAMDTLTLEAELAEPGSAAGEGYGETALAGAIRQRIKEQLGVSVTVRLTAPGTLPRAEGKARRVLDLRPKQ